LKNLEIGQEILFGRTVSEITPNPPLKKGGRGDFWQGRGPNENPCYCLQPLPIYELLLMRDRHVLFEQSRFLTFFQHFQLFYSMIPREEKTLTSKLRNGKWGLEENRKT